MNEFAQAKLYAHKILDRVNADPDDDQAVVARQFLRLVERSETWVSERDQTRKVYGDAINRELATIKEMKSTIQKAVVELAALIPHPEDPSTDEWPCANPADRKCLQTAYITLALSERSSVSNGDRG